MGNITKNKIKRLTRLSAVMFSLSIGLIGCYPSEELNEPVNQPDEVVLTDLDREIQENFTDKYGMSIRYRFVDRFITPDKRVSPPDIDLVEPMLGFIQNFWIDPYLEVENGTTFFTDHVPSEIVLLGGLIFNNDGTVTLGTADAGAQITFTNVNAIDIQDNDWKLQQLQTVYHEFAHTVHQRYKLPTAFETISPRGYTSAGAWFALNDDQALERGFVSPYATSSPNEDFAETVAHFLFDTDFYDNFMTQVDTCSSVECENANVGRVMIGEKMTSIAEHYQRVTNVNLEDLREAIQARL